MRLPVRRNPFGPRQIFACNVKIGELGRARDVEAARRLFDEMSDRDVVSWNAMVSAYWQNGRLEESKRMFESMPTRNVISWNSMIAGCLDNGMLEEACRYFSKMPQRCVTSWNAMISGFIRHNQMEEAAKLFQQMPRRNVISYTAMVAGYAQIGEIEQARALFNQIPNKNAVSWTVMLSGYVGNGKFDEARQLFDEMPEKNIMASTSMITCYCKEGQMETARKMFEEIPCRDLVSWNAMISGYVQNGQAEEALKLYSQILETSKKPDDSTLVVALRASALLVSLQQGRQIHVTVIKNGFESSASVGNALVSMYNKCGSICDSHLVFGEIHCPDLVSWNTIIAGYAQHGHYEKSLGLFNEMLGKGWKPDGITFLSILSACGHAGKVEESLDWFNSMACDYGITPRAEHCSCIVDILSRAGQLANAYKFISEMSLEADASVWGALLGACRVHLNVELGELAAKKVMELDPWKSAPYTLLSNIYAAAGMWTEVTRVRGLMKEQGVKKQAGHSWIEVGNRVHLFLGGDTSHPDINKIRLELENIDLHMKLTGHVAIMDEDIS